MAIYLKDLQINSFRGIRNCTLNNFKDINILTGDNNSGKTTILENINMLNNIDSLVNLVYTTTRGYTRTSISGLSTFEQINYLFPVDDKNAKISVSFNTVKENIDLQIIKENKYEMLYENEIRKMQGYDNESHDDSHREIIETESMKLEYAINGQTKKTESFNEYNRFNRDDKVNSIYKTVYISPFRHTLNDVYLSETLDDADLFMEMLDVLKEFDDGILNINADTNNHSSYRKRYTILSKNHKKSIPLELYGDGMKKAIMLMSAVIAAKDGILLLDEFETAIHTTAMNRTFEWIMKACMKLNVQLFLTSHSKEAIEKVLKCCPDLSENINLYTLFNRKGKTIVRTLDCTDAIEAIDELNLEVR